MKGLALCVLCLFLLAGCEPQAARPAAVEKTAVSSERLSVASESRLAAGQAGSSKSHGLRVWFFNLDSANPSGAWSWGQSDAKGTLGSFDLFPWNGRTADGDVPYWTVAGGAINNPNVGRNTTDHVLHGVQPHELAFHPGPDRRLCVVRWTAPQSGSVFVWGCFGAGDSGKVDVYVVKTNGDGQATEVLFKALNTPADEPFKVTTRIREGETIDFAVGNAGAWEFDSTPLAATIVLEPDPVSGSK